MLGVGEVLIDAEPAAVHDLTVAEGEHLGGQTACLVGGGQDSIQVFHHGLVVIAVLDRSAGVSADHHQEVVEVMSDGAGNIADGFHLLRLRAMLLDLFPSAVVAHDFEVGDKAPAAVMDGGALGLAGEHLAIFLFVHDGSRGAVFTLDR